MQNRHIYNIYNSNWAICTTKNDFFQNQSNFFSLDTQRREFKKHSQWKDGGIPASLARKPQSLVILPQVSQKLGQTAQQETLFLARGLLDASGFNRNLFQKSPHTCKWIAHSKSFGRICNNWLTPIRNTQAILLIWMLSYYTNAIRLNQC